MLLSVPDAQLVVVTLVLDDPGGLKRTQTSIEAQTNHNFAQLIVDGGSQAATWDIINDARDRHGASVLPGPDQGIYDGMNRSLAILDPDQWVLFLNAGDRFAHSNASAFLLGAISQTSRRWGFSPVMIWEPGGSIRGIPKSEPFSARNFAYWKTRVVHQGMVAQVAAMRSVGNFRTDMPNCADYDQILRLGIVEPPEEWQTVFSDYEAGGRADQRGYSVTLLQARCRRELLRPRGGEYAYHLWTLTARLCKVWVANRVDWAASHSWLPKNWRAMRRTHNSLKDQDSRDTGNQGYGLSAEW